MGGCSTQVSAQNYIFEIVVLFDKKLMFNFEHNPDVLHSLVLVYKDLTWKALLKYSTWSHGLEQQIIWIPPPGGQFPREVIIHHGNTWKTPPWELNEIKKGGSSLPNSIPFDSLSCPLESPWQSRPGKHSVAPHTQLGNEPLTPNCGTWGSMEQWKRPQPLPFSLGLGSWSKRAVINIPQSRKQTTSHHAILNVQQYLL